MARRGENIYLRKDGRYEGRYVKGQKENGRTAFGYVYARRYMQVKELLVKYKAEEHAPPIAYKRYTLREWLMHWLEEQTKPYIRETTYATYGSQLRTHLLPALGKAAVRSLTKERIQEFANDLAQHVSAGMVHNVLRLLSSALKSAKSKGLIDHNPCEGLRRPMYKRREPRVLSLKEQEKLERFAVQADNAEFVLCLYTGLRVGELCALKWEDVDFQTNTLHVRRSAKRVKRVQGTAVIMGLPKTDDSKRAIPVPAFVMEYLRPLKRESGRVFDVDIRTMQQRLEKLANTAGLKGVHMHTLRHTFATRCLEVGVGIEALAALMGHSSPNVTMGYYAHCTHETKVRSVNRLKQIAC